MTTALLTTKSQKHPDTEAFIVSSTWNTLGYFFLSLLIFFILCLSFIVLLFFFLIFLLALLPPRLPALRFPLNLSVHTSSSSSSSVCSSATLQPPTIRLLLSPDIPLLSSHSFCQYVLNKFNSLFLCSVLVNRANDWLRVNAHLRVNTCESIEVKGRVDGVVDTNKSCFFEADHTKRRMRNMYIRALR